MKVRDIDIEAVRGGFWIDDKGDVVPVFDNCGHWGVLDDRWPDHNGYTWAAKKGFAHVTFCDGARYFTADFDYNNVTKAALRTLLDLMAHYAEFRTFYDIVVLNEGSAYQSHRLCDGSDAQAAIREVRSWMHQKFSVRVVEAA
jgi:hypothetical protein